MDQSVRDYLIRAHCKVIAHYRQLLGSSSLSQSERQRIQERVTVIEAELRALSGNASTLNVARAA